MARWAGWEIVEPMGSSMVEWDELHAMSTLSLLNLTGGNPVACSNGGIDEFMLGWSVLAPVCSSLVCSIAEAVGNGSNPTT